MFTLKNNTAQIIQRLQAAQAAIPDLVATGVEQLGELSVTSLHDHCPVDEEDNNGVLPGEAEHLADSFVTGDVSVGVVSTMEIGTTEPIKYQYVTEGTDSPILPVEKKALWWPALEHPVASVSGQEPQPFQLDALAEIESLVPGVGAEVVQKLVEKLKGM